MTDRAGITRAFCWTVFIFACGCTSLQTFRFEQVNADLPVEVGDEVRIYLYDAQPGGTDFRITGISRQAVSVTPLSDTQAAEITYLWKEIARIDSRQPDTAKTSLLVILLLGLLHAASELGETLEDIREIFQSGD